MQLTEHFSLEEMVRSGTATALQIDNSPNQQIISRLKTLCQEVLEPLRQHFGVPVAISSGYRCPQLNKAVGGTKSSQHLTGEAADIRLPDEETGRRWFVWMMDNLHFDQLIWEKSSPSSTHHWIHVSYRHDGHQRQHVIQNLVRDK